MTLRVLLDNVGNPDRQQDPTRPLPGVGRRWQKVDGFEAASEACRKYIEANDLGGGNWTGGEIIDAANNPVGRVSFNGAVWPPGPHVVGQEPLWPKQKAKPADPNAFERRRLDVPGYGTISLGGCYRVATLDSVPGEVLVNGRRHDFMTYVDVTPEGLRSVRPFELMVGGSFSDSVPCPKEVLAAVAKVAKAFAKSDEGKLMVLSNEVRDRRSHVEFCARQVSYAEDELAKRREAKQEADRRLEEAEALLAEREPAGPTP